MEKERKMGIRECFDKLTSNEAVSFVGFETTSPIEEQSKHLDSLMMVFKSALLQKCVYSTLPFTERSRIHLLVSLVWSLRFFLINQMMCRWLNFTSSK